MTLVLILVLVDYALGDRFSCGFKVYKGVLILVLVDYALGAIVMMVGMISLLS